MTPRATSDPATGKARQINRLDCSLRATETTKAASRINENRTALREREQQEMGWEN
jgi:phosphopantetheine adenylyltransferase